MVPNVELHQTYIGSESLSATIRGIGFDDIEKSLEPTVGVAVDGVFMASNSGAVFDMYDVESVEVLRGPQGTLFGAKYYWWSHQRKAYKAHWQMGR